MKRVSKIKHNVACNNLNGKVASLYRAANSDCRATNLRSGDAKGPFDVKLSVGLGSGLSLYGISVPNVPPPDPELSEFFSDFLSTASLANCCTLR